MGHAAPKADAGCARSSLSGNWLSRLMIGFVEEPGSLARLESRLRSEEHHHHDGQPARPKPHHKRATRCIQPRVTDRDSRAAGRGGSRTGRSSSIGRQLRSRSPARFVPEGEAPSADRYIVSADYLPAMRIPVLRGRGFTDQDRLGTEPVAMISETTARQIWPNEEPIGKSIQLGGRSEQGPWFRIVGIVGDVRQVSLDQDSANANLPA